MLETIIKRDGRREPFDAKKINSWGEHAARQHGIDTGEWTTAVRTAMSGMGKECTSEALQRSLIKGLLSISTWDAVLMAGTLEASVQQKAVFPNGIPSVREQFTKLADRGTMIAFSFTEGEWDQINAMVDHNLDWQLPQFAIEYIAKSYALCDVATGETLETPQFIYMRMACAVGSSYPEGERIPVIAETYEMLSTQILSLPTPDWTNLGTPDNGLASCCLFTASDDRRSLAAATHISYVMTYSSAGLGYHHSVRSIGDPVRNGTIEHQGETGYLKANAAAAAANRQKKRGGAITAFVSAYSKEADEIIHGRNPLAPIDKAIRGIDVNVVITDDLLSRAIRREPSLTFSSWSHPELYAQMHKPNFNKGFEKMMAEEVAKASPDQLFDSRKRVTAMGGVAHMSGRLYSFFVDNANKHTPYKEPIYSSNLCAEIMEATKPYKCTSELYREDDDVSGEVAMCNLAAINQAKVSGNPELHKRAVKAALRVIDYCINHGHYELNHIGYTAKRRMNAGVGIMNTAADMAKRHLKFNDKAGLTHMHEFSERHAFFLIEASLELGKEKGNAPWIGRTKWAGYTNHKGEYIKAWMPIDTGNKKVAKEHGIELKMDWEDLRERVAENGGIRNTTLFACMPGESSSKALGGANSVYPIRDYGLDKTDSTTKIEWLAEGTGNPDYEYQIAYELTVLDQIKFYSVIQRFGDQGISQDFWYDLSKRSKVIQGDEILEKYKYMSIYGLKSHYYTVAKTQMSRDEMDRDQKDLMAMLGLADQAGAANEDQMVAADAEDFNAAVCGIDNKGGCSL